ncbi:Molybdenum cofactor guanylyltransferase [Paraliobacillus sp. PM-2]|uniref:molybdenum cofactor guanylyltransferase n=1 Tax=Paraliobacillus sp. PM-2 TaxID=1462524 RepID=UPI00061C00C4|nr:molybdenum cofactor guanylyltransferase [Paraliobacillus sp. PM-2]CQR46570.1 Molybdenum cofactor guanylyltransferase [Paraliobacillus sp. PM-2]
MRQSIVGVLLAGGESRRFGRPKMFEMHKGKQFYRCSLDAIKPYVNHVYIVTQPHYVDRFANLGNNVAVITDLPSVKGKGPLAGVLTVMNAEQATWYLVIPTDVPFVEQPTIQTILKQLHVGYQAVIPTSNGKTQPLFGIYHYTVKSIIHKMLKEGSNAAYQLLNQLKVKTVNMVDEQSFININAQQDYHYFINNNSKE